MEHRATSQSDGLSDLIGDIYDCVLDPSRWDATLTDLHTFLDLDNCLLYITDLRSKSIRFQRCVGIAPEQQAQLTQHAAEVVRTAALIPDLMTRPIDEPFVTRRDVPGDAAVKTRYFREWAEPQGLIDSMLLYLMRGPERTAEIGMGRHERFGLIGDREVRLVRRLTPHLRRAVTISDLIDMRALEAEALNSVLDGMSIGIVLVAGDGAIVHANRAAEMMLERGGPISSVKGRLAAKDVHATTRLRRILAGAARAEADIGAEGIGVALSVADEAPATAHILPLARGDLRTRLAPRATAAVFVTAAGEPAPAAFTGVAEAFGLTPAETRVLSRLTNGASIDEAAGTLCITRPTVKTHIKRILSKTGARRQADLVALVRSLTPPTGPPRKE